jgi:hypothetical protein
MTSMKNFPAPRSVLAMIGLIDSNISSILQACLMLAAGAAISTQLGRVYLQSSWNPSCRLSLS